MAAKERKDRKGLKFLKMGNDGGCAKPDQGWAKPSPSPRMDATPLAL